MNYSVSLPNGKTVYTVNWAVDRLSDEHDIEAGISVAIKGKQVAQLACLPDTVQQALEGIDLNASP